MVEIEKVINFVFIITAIKLQKIIRYIYNILYKSVQLKLNLQLFVYSAFVLDKVDMQIKTYENELIESK